MPARILLLNKAYPPWPGGMENHVRNLAEGLAARGWHVSVLCSGRHSFCCEARQPGLRVYRSENLATFWSQPISPSILWQIRNVEADIVHIHTPFPLGAVACLLHRKPTSLVVTWHSDIVRQRSARPLLALLEHSLLRRAAAIIVTSPPMIEQSAILPAFREKCHIIPLGIDPSPFLQPCAAVRDLAERLKDDLPPPIVLFVGRLVGYKGVEMLLEALRSVNVSGLVVGDGPLRARLERESHRKALGRRVRFAGHVPEDELPSYYLAADLFVLPSVSRNEAFGMCQLEAMAAGLPVISTDLPGGVPWVNKHGLTGLVVPPGNAQALGDAIAYLVEDRRRRSEFGEAGRKRVLEFFTLEISLRRHEELYHGLLRDPRDPCAD